MGNMACLMMTAQTHETSPEQDCMTGKHCFGIKVQASYLDDNILYGALKNHAIDQNNNSNNGPKK